MKQKYDAIVIGGGHNGLTTANVLAKGGLSVLILEARQELGGLASREEFLPGYFNSGILHDTSTLRYSLIKDLRLDSYGLQISKERETVTLVNRDGDYIHLYQDAEKTANEIARYSAKDAQSYMDYRQFCDKISPFLYSLFSEMPPELNRFGSKEILTLARKGIALKRLGKNVLNEFLKVAPMSLRDFLDERFELDFLKAGLAFPALTASTTGPYSSYTTLNLLIHESISQYQVEGGAHALIKALEQSAKELGVDIACDSKVVKIKIVKNKAQGVLLESGREISTEIVASSVNPKHCFLDLIDPEHLSYRIEQDMVNYRSRGTTAKIDIALRQPIKFKNIDLSYKKNIRLSESLIDLEKSFDPSKYGKYSGTPMLDIYIPGKGNHNYAPKGHQVLSILVHFIPYHLHKSWDISEKEFMANGVINKLEQHTENLKNSIEGIKIYSPLDLENDFGLTEGHIYHGEMAIDQMMTRPIPACASYATPVKGLFLCGSGSHGGGGITCVPGVLAARKILSKR